MVEEIQQSIWNFDGAELYEIFGIKKEFMEDISNWNLEGAYWSLRSLRREIDAKLKRHEKSKILAEHEKEKNKGKKRKTEKQIVDSWIDDLDKKRKEYNGSKQDDNEKVQFYLELEKVYMKLCHLMKKHGLYFREGEDSRLAVLRR